MQLTAFLRVISRIAGNVAFLARRRTRVDPVHEHRIMLSWIAQTLTVSRNNGAALPKTPKSLCYDHKYKCSSIPSILTHPSPQFFPLKSHYHFLIPRWSLLRRFFWLWPLHHLLWQLTSRCPLEQMAYFAITQRPSRRLWEIPWPSICMFPLFQPCTTT